MLTLLGSLLSSVVAGGATGILGMVLQRYFDHLKVKADLEVLKAKQTHELAMRDKDAAIMREEWEQRSKIAQTETEGRKDVADTQAFQSSLLKEPERYSNAQVLTPGQQWILVCLDALRGVIRPLLTVYLCALTTYIWWQVRQLIATEDLNATDVIEIWRFVVETILYLTTTVILWWFGTRNKQKAPVYAPTVVR